MSVSVWVDGEKLSMESWTFPAGERNIRLEDTEQLSDTAATVECLYSGSDDLIDIILATNALRNINPGIDITLYIPYFPFARQDRVMTPGEANALQAIAQVINSLNFTLVKCLDAHSDVLPALFQPGRLRNIPQWDLWEYRIASMNTEYSRPALVSPDNGASKKIYKLAHMLGWPVIEAGKQRNPVNGEITGSTVSSFDTDQFDTLYVVDDICDGGRTFIELAKVIRNTGYTGSLTLCTTHGIYSSGREVLYDHYSTVSCIINLSED